MSVVCGLSLMILLILLPFTIIWNFDSINWLHCLFIRKPLSVARNHWLESTEEEIFNRLCLASLICICFSNVLVLLCGGSTLFEFLITCYPLHDSKKSSISVIPMSLFFRLQVFLFLQFDVIILLLFCQRRTLIYNSTSLFIKFKFCIQDG